MRPNTLSEAYERIRAGVPREIAMPEFLDVFYTRASAAERYACLADEPAVTGDARLDALAGATAEYLARQWELTAIPSWVFAPNRYLPEPWHTTSIDDPGFKEYLTWASPAEFRSRNIFTEERPLRRARMPRGPDAT